MRGYVYTWSKALFCATALSFVATVSWSQSLTWLGTLGGGSSAAYGVSADGRVVVGEARNAEGRERAFRWTADGGLQDLGVPSSVSSRASAVSGDGRVVVGEAQDFGQIYAFRWSADNGAQNLNTVYADLLTSGSSLWHATAVSPDGRYIVGSVATALQGAGKPSCWIRGSRCTAMWIATAASMTPTCCACCSSSAARATATKTSTGTASSMTPTC